MKRKEQFLRIPTVGRHTTSLYTKRGGVEFGTSVDKSVLVTGMKPLTGTVIGLNA